MHRHLGPFVKYRPQEKLPPSVNQVRSGKGQIFPAGVTFLQISLRDFLLSVSGRVKQIKGNIYPPGILGNLGSFVSGFTRDCLVYDHCQRGIAGDICGGAERLLNHE